MVSLFKSFGCISSTDLLCMFLLILSFLFVFPFLSWLQIFFIFTVHMYKYTHAHIYFPIGTTLCVSYMFWPAVFIDYHFLCVPPLYCIFLPWSDCFLVEKLVNYNRRYNIFTCFSLKHTVKYSLCSHSASLLVSPVSTLTNKSANSFLQRAYGSAMPSCVRAWGVRKIKFWFF